MKIGIYSNRPNSPSWLFYKDLLITLHQISSVEVQVLDTDHIEDDAQDVYLLFGDGFNTHRIKKYNPDSLIGRLEPRAAQKMESTDYDFVVVNSIESADYFSYTGKPTFIYPTFPFVSVEESNEPKKNEKRLVLGYHGNKIHLEAMLPRITSALEDLNKEVPIELWAMYNIENLGKWGSLEKRNIHFPVKHIQYKPENYAKYMSKVDIGIIPQFIPVSGNRLFRWLIGSIGSKFNERYDNYIFRFKETTNNGRLFIFAQYGIPVIADMTPSSCSFLGENEHGLLAYSTSQWYQHLNFLAQSKDIRKEYGSNLKKRFRDYIEDNRLNYLFLDFLRNVKDNV